MSTESEDLWHGSRYLQVPTHRHLTLFTPQKHLNQELPATFSRSATFSEVTSEHVAHRYIVP